MPSVTFATYVCGFYSRAARYNIMYPVSKQFRGLLMETCQDNVIFSILSSIFSYLSRQDGLFFSIFYAMRKGEGEGRTSASAERNWHKNYSPKLMKTT